MPPVELIQPTGQPAVDEYLAGLIDIFELAFPDRVRAYYLAGSFATGEAVASSDIDFRAIFKGEFAAGEAERIARLRDSCGRISAFQLDMPVRCEADYLSGAEDRWPSRRPACSYTAPISATGCRCRRRTAMPG